MKHSPLTFLLISMLLTPALVVAQDAPADSPAPDAPGVAAPAPEAPAAEAPADEAPADEAAPEQAVAEEPGSEPAAEAAPADEAAPAAEAVPEQAVAEEPAVEPAAEEPEPAAEEPALAVEPEPEVSAVETAAGLGQMEDDLASSDAEHLGDPTEIDHAEGDEDVHAAPAESLPWAAQLLWDQTATIDTFSRSRRLTYNPTYLWTFSLRPSWTFGGEIDDSTTAQQTGVTAGSGITVGFRQDLEIEMTQSDSTSEERQLIFADGQISAGYTFYHSDAWHVGGRINAQLPYSLASRAAHRVIGPGLGGTFARSFDVLHGLQLATAFGYRHWLSTSNAAVIGRRGSTRLDRGRHPATSYLPGTISNTSSYACEGNRSCAGGATSGRDLMNGTLAFSLSPASRLSVATSFTWVWTRGNELASVDPADLGVVTAPSASDTLGDNQTHWRNFTVFSLSVGYDVASYLSLEASYTAFALNVNENGARIENPLWNEKSTVSLTATIRLDSLYSQVHQAPTRAANDSPDRAAAGDDPTPTAQADTAHATW